MISTSGAFAAAVVDRARRAHDRAHLHLVDLRALQAEPAAARAEHRVRLLQLLDPRAHLLVLAPPRAAAGTRAAAGRAGGSSPAGPPSPRRSPRSRTAASAAAGRARCAGPSSSRAMIISCTTGSRSSPKNMCSVRQRPMPCAPNSRARAASSGVSAFARTFSRRTSSAQPSTVWKSSLICGGTRRTGPTITRPVPPSIVSSSPSRSVVLADRRRRAPSGRSRGASQPATHGLPIPRATTAACEVMPPCTVRIPFAAIIPWMSSGVVSQRTRITCSRSPRAAAVSASKTILPLAAPGLAFRPVAATS